MFASIVMAALVVQGGSDASAASQAKKVTPLADLTLDLSQIGRVEARTYEFARVGKTPSASGWLGILHTRTRLGGDGVVLGDIWTIGSGAEARTFSVIQTCARDNFLSPRSVSLTGDGDEGPIALSLTTRSVDANAVKEGIQSPEREELLLPPHTLTDLALLRIIPLLPQEKGAQVSFPFWLEVDELHLKKDHVVECEGPDTISIGTRKVPCTKYRHQGGGIRDSTLWVDKDGVLHRILIDGEKQLTLTSPERESEKPGSPR